MTQERRTRLNAFEAMLGMAERFRLSWRNVGALGVPLTFRETAHGAQGIDCVDYSRLHPLLAKQRCKAKALK